jgi:hypothetical protein
MKEIGGYFELESAPHPPFHPGAVALNSGRNALRYIIRTYQIREMFVPRYTCPVVFDALEAEQCSVKLYSLNSTLVPEAGPDALASGYFLYTNYFGVCGTISSSLEQKAANLIVDQAQAFYAPPRGIASFYSPRKFFGLPDGGLALTKRTGNLNLDKDQSYERCAHLLKRHDLTASAGYPDFQHNDETLAHQPVKHMSGLTQALMSSIDYAGARRKRLENFEILHNKLEPVNEFKFNCAAKDVPLAYPLLIRSETLRKKLIASKIYVASYWPGSEAFCPPGSVERYMQQYMLPLPIDQRYGPEEMKFILEQL